MVFTRHDNTIGAAIPFVVTAADHDDLPPPPAGVAFSGQAVVMLSHRFGWEPYHNTGFVLACWHLPVGAGPRLQDLLYYDFVSATLPRKDQWTPDVSVLAHKNFFDYTYNGSRNPDGYRADTGLLWLKGPRRWLMTYNGAQRPIGGIPAAVAQRPVYARFAERITDLNTAPDIKIFDPETRAADRALLLGPQSYAYGPYPLENYTTWDPRTGILDLHYLLSIYDPPYNVQIMRTQIRVP